MKLPRRFLGVGALVALATAGCGGNGDVSTPRFLSLGTAPPGGAFFVVGGAFAEVLGESGLRVTAEATKGSGENIRRLAPGKLDIAISNAAVADFAARGEDGWGRAYPVQAVMTLAPNVATFVSPRRHDINRIQDLAGNRVGEAGTHGSDSTKEARWPDPSARERERMDPPEVGPVAEDGERDPVAER